MSKQTKKPKLTNTPAPTNETTSETAPADAPKPTLGQTAPADAPKPTLGQIAKANAEKRRNVAQKDVFVFIKNPEKPIAPQAMAILNTIAAHPNGIVRPELVEALKPVLVTRQPAERILTYYQAALVDAGLVRIDNPERVAKTPAPNDAETETKTSDASGAPAE